MKLFRAIIQEDIGKPTKEDGKSIQELRNNEYFYAAETINIAYQEAIDETERLNGYNLALLMRIEEIAPSIKVIQNTDE